jgi:hypothetical protein
VQDSTFEQVDKLVDSSLRAAKKQWSRKPGLVGAFCWWQQVEQQEDHSDQMCR